MRKADAIADAGAAGTGTAAWFAASASAFDLGPLGPVVVAVLSAVASRVAVAVAAYVVQVIAARGRVELRHLGTCSIDCAPGCPVDLARRPR